VYLCPQLRPGEILVERMRDIPVIIADESVIFPAPTVETMGFDARLAQRTELAHAEFMKRTSRLHWCNWRACYGPATRSRRCKEFLLVRRCHEPAPRAIPRPHHPERGR